LNKKTFSKEKTLNGIPGSKFNTTQEKTTLIKEKETNNTNEKPLMIMIKEKPEIIENEKIKKVQTLTPLKAEQILKKEESKPSTFSETKDNEKNQKSNYF